MNLLSIGSSSSGNCYWVYDDETHILIDAGIAAKKVMEKTGRKSFDALFISHEHSDHISGAGPLGRKLKIPIYINKVLLNDRLQHELRDCELRDLNDTSVITVGKFTVRTFSTKHDARFSLGFVVEEKDSDTRLAYITDTGSISKTMREATKNCNVIVLECDYDDALLEAYDEYDQALKERIASNFGHLSNAQAMDFLTNFDMSTLKKIIIAHMSPRTNSIEKVNEHIMEKFANHSDKFLIAPFDKPIVL
jgi:phosphoribosyl 1,2-cyclic phosphodiesterase